MDHSCQAPDIPFLAVIRHLGVALAIVMKCFKDAYSCAYGRQRQTVISQFGWPRQFRLNSLPLSLPLSLGLPIRCRETGPAGGQ